MRRWPVGARDSARRIQARHRADCPRSDGGAMGGGGRIEKHHFMGLTLMHYVALLTVEPSVALQQPPSSSTVKVRVMS